MLQKIRILILIVIPATFIVAHANPYLRLDGVVYSLVDVPAIGRKLKGFGLPEDRQYYYYITNRSGSNYVFAHLSFECSKDESYSLFKAIGIMPEILEKPKTTQPPLRSKYSHAYATTYFAGDLYGVNHKGQHGGAVIALEYSCRQNKMHLFYQGPIQ